MSIENELRSFIVADVDVLALVNDRVYPVIVPRDTATAYIAYARMSTDRTYMMPGADTTTTARFRMTCWDDTYDGAIDLSNKLRICLSGVSGLWGAITVQRCSVEDESDQVEVSPEMLEHRLYGRNLDIQITFTE